MREYKISERGNVFVFILLAIVLLGLLTVVLSRSSSDSNETGDFERVSIVASELMNYAKSIEVGVQALLARGCSENELSFWHDSNGDGTEDASDEYFNIRAPANHTCHIFEPEGMGLAFAPPKENWLDTNFDTETEYENLIFNGNLHKETATDTAANTLRKKDLMMIVPYIREDICAQINNSSDVNIATVNPPKEDDTDAAAMTTKFTGAFTLGNGIDAEGSDSGAGVFTESNSGCTRPDDEDSFMFFYVLNHRG